MKPSEAVKPISELKAHAAKIIRELNERQGTLIITQNGMATVVLQDIRAYEQLQDSLALLKLLAQSRKSVRAKRLVPVGKAFGRVRRRVKVANEG